MLGHCRLSNWEERLSEYIKSLGKPTFLFGRMDCLMFAAGGVKAVTGFDPGKGHRGKYNSHASSVRYLKTLGAKSPSDYLDGLFPQVGKAQARRGDLVSVEGNIGICIGTVALFVGVENDQSGLIRIPFREWQAAWSVG
jgi:hypothetical protein